MLICLKINIPKAIIKKVISLEETIDNLTKRITQGLRMKFSEFSGGTNKGEKINVIVSFLAMLELVKQGIIHVNQENNFSDIHMESKEIGVPRYN
jgi:segregation and condensation protein A